MRVLNINSYYFSSSLYEPMEEYLIKKGINLTTYVPIHLDYKIRDEVNFKPSKHVQVSICYKKRDRLFFHYKHFKIIKNFFKNYDIPKYDILHAHSLFSNGYIAYKANKKYKTPYI